MPVESAFDRSAFVSDAAVTFIYKNQGTRYTMRGIFDSDYQGVNVADPEFASDQPQITLPTSALPFELLQGDKVYYNEEVYNVRNFRADGTGMTVLVLEITTGLSAP